jgi:RNA-binding protein
MMNSRMKSRIKRSFSAERPTIWVGKGGATEEIVGEIDRQLERSEVVKAKILQTALQTEEAKDVAVGIAARTESTLVEVRGHTFILYRKRKRKQL